MILVRIQKNHSIACVCDAFYKNVLTVKPKPLVMIEL